MKVIYKKARRGYKFIMSGFGFEKSHVRSRFEQDSKQREKFEKSVPITWLEKGYVEEVAI